jgi:predicted PurR-regulated permease PerM
MLIVFSSGLTVVVLYFARDIIVPITLALLLSFLMSPIVRALRRLRIGRVTAVTVTVLIAFIVISGFGAIVVREISSLGQDLPQYRNNLQAKVQSLPEVIPGGGLFRRTAAILSDLRKELIKSETGASDRVSPTGSPAGEQTKPVPVEIQQPALEPLQLVKSIVGPLLQPLAIAGLVVVFVIIILVGWEDLRDRVLRLAGRRDLYRTTEAMNDAAQRVSRYLLRQLLVNLTCAVPIGVGLSAIGIPNALLWAIFVVVLRFVPYLGIIIAAAFPIALAIAVDPGWTLCFWTISLFGVVELVVANLVEPWVYGAGAGLSPVALIVAAVFWTWLWGPVGLLLSTPLTACLVVLGRHVPHLQFLDVLLGHGPVLTPQETFYQRLLANDPDEAAEQAEEFAREQSIAEFFDSVAIPALARAQADSDRDALSAGWCADIKEAVAAMLENLSDYTGEDGGFTSADAVRAKPSTAPTICCIIGRNGLDAAAALLLAHLLRQQGWDGAVAVMAADLLSSEASHERRFKDAKLICLSLISTSAPARIRYLVRRIRRRAPGAKVLIGAWGLSPGELAETKSTIGNSADIVTTLGDAVTKIHDLVTTPMDLDLLAETPLR